MIYYGHFIKFVIARAWYNWITSYSNASVVEVNVIQLNTNHVQDLKDSKDIPEAARNLPKGYLG